MKILLGTIVLSLSLAVQTCQADLSLIADDFGANTISSGSRFTSGDIDTGNWVQRSGATAGTWAVSGGQLTNPSIGDNDEQGAHLLNSVSSTDTTLTELTVSFDYTVGAGTTLYFYSSLFTGPNGTTGNMSRITRKNGDYFATGTDFNNNFTSALNVKDGATPTGGTATALTSLVGATSGTFSQTYDISGYTGVGSIADVSHILAVFTVDTAAAGDGAITIDNFSVTAAVPEPSSMLMLCGALAGLATRRRRRTQSTSRA